MGRGFQGSGGVGRTLFNLTTIEAAFRQFQHDFPTVNDQLEMRREEFSDTIIANLMDGYRFLNDLQRKGIDLFSMSGLYNMLELNHVVLCGTDPSVRMEYFRHLQETRKTFSERIHPILRWFQKWGETLDPYEIAAEYYGRSLSFPQLFYEGNHRTENMVVNYYLLNRGLPPYLIEAKSAVDYLDVSARIKFSTAKGRGERKRVKHSKDFRVFLRDFGNADCLIEEEA